MEERRNSAPRPRSRPVLLPAPEPALAQLRARVGAGDAGASEPLRRRVSRMRDGSIRLRDGLGVGSGA